MTTIRLSQKLLSKAQAACKISERSVKDQIEHWIKIGKIAEDNPDLTYEFIKKLLIAQEEADSLELRSYQFGSQKQQN